MERVLPRPLTVVQVGDIASVAPALTAALEGIDVRYVPLTGHPIGRLARAVPAVWRSGADIAHVHWLPNGLIGPLLRVPWVLHLHGDDIRSTPSSRRPVYRRIVGWPDRVIVSTPDLLEHVEGTWIPTPIAPLTLAEAPRFDVFVNARAHPEKSSEVAFAALRLIHDADPSLRLAALDGPAFEDGPWERVPWGTKVDFHRLLAASRVVVGQFRAGALGIADLEALALSRPLVTWVRDVYPDPPPVLNARTPDEVAAAVLAAQEASGGPEWVARTHGPELVAARLMGLYREVLTGAGRPEG